MVFHYRTDGARYRVEAKIPDRVIEARAHRDGVRPSWEWETIGWVWRPDERKRNRWRANTPREAPVGTRFKTRREAAEALYRQRWGHRIPGASGIRGGP